MSTAMLKSGRVRERRSGPLSGDGGQSSRSLHSLCAEPVRAGYLITGVFVLVFLFWGGLIPLAGGSLAPGLIAPESSRKTVQHLEGGILAQIDVRDGDTVKAGQMLFRIDDTQPRTTVEILRNQQMRVLARQARLEAELAGRFQIIFPSELLDAEGAPVAVALSQVQIFETRRSSMEARKQVLQRRLQQLHEQMNAFRAQERSAANQLDLVREEAEAKMSLMKRGLIAKPEALRLQRMEADMTGRLGELIASVARTEQQIGETNMQLLQLDAERIDQVADESDKVRLEFAELHQKLKSAEDVLRRAVVAAPVSGRVVNLRFKTIGGIIQRGEPVLDIVPAEDALVIEARVNPVDIHVVHPGLPAHVHLSISASRTMPRLFGTVRSVAADRSVDQATKQAYYLARIEINRAELQRLTGVEPIAGMSAEVLIVAQERSMLRYLLQPFQDALRRSLREV